MHLLNLRTGFFIKEWENTRELRVYYFFIDDNYRLFYTPEHLLLSIAAKTSQNADEVSKKLSSQQVPSLSLQEAKCTELRKFDYAEQVQFPHQTCFEILLAPGQKFKGILSFALFDDDCTDLHSFVEQYDAHVKSVRSQQASGRSNPTLEKENSNTDTSGNLPFEEMVAWIAQTSREKIKNRNESEFTLLEDVTADLSTKNNLASSNSENSGSSAEQNSLEQEAEEKSKEAEILNEKDGVVFSGRMENGLPHGQCTEFYNKEGISFVGEFRNGRKQGLGYFVNSNLDTVYCEFIDDELVGI